MIAVLDLEAPNAVVNREEDGVSVVIGDALDGDDWRYGGGHMTAVVLRGDPARLKAALAQAVRSLDAVIESLIDEDLGAM